MIEPLDYDKLTESQQKTYREIAALRDRNVARINKIESVGMQIDIWTARIEHLEMSLLWAEIITVDQLLAIQKDWELSLRAQTQAIVPKVDEILAMQNSQNVPKRKLWTPSGS